MTSPWGDDDIADPHWMSQYLLLDTYPKSSLDFIGKYENLHDDWSELCKIIGICNIELPWINKTSKEHDSCVDLNPHTRQLVYERYKEDYELGGYSI